MSRDKSMTKSGWKKQDAAYRKDISDRRKAKRLRKAHARLFEFLAGWRETRAILADSDTMAAIAEAEADIAADNVVPL